VYTLVSRLVIHAAGEFDEEDYNAVTSYLATKKGIKTKLEWLDHFYFNREWWKERVRMYPPPAKKHAARIRQVHDFIKKTVPLKRYYCAALKEWLDELEKDALEGSFEDLCDVTMFIWNEKDSHGLDKWFRLRGSDRTENVHQRQRVAFGPWGVGAQTGHYLLLLVSYFYNVNGAISRLNAPDFGHPWLHYQDRIHLRYLEVFGVDVFPRHSNLSQFKAVDDFVAVGIGPLWYNNDYVEPGEPDARLKGDLRFTAARMKVRCPPLHIAHPAERKIWRDFLKTTPNPSWRDWCALAKIFKEKTDCKTVFPKLPGMLRVYYKRWKASQLIVQLEGEMKGPYQSLLQELAIPADGASAAVLHQEATLHELNEDRYHAMDIDGAPKDPLPVPPAVAPQQTEFVLSAGGIKNDRKCSNWPACAKMASECRGFKPKDCIEVIAGRITQEQLNTAAAVRDENRRMQKRQQAKEKYDQKQQTKRKRD
jgi:hypothetical protein